jgi:phytoene dehydrogenase-like protein
VEEIIIQDGRIRGVRLQNGETITAEVVLATCDPHTAFRLATPGGIERRLVERMKHVPSAKEVAPFVANIATSGPIVLKKHQSMRHDDADLNKAVCLIGSADDVRDTFKAARRGDISATPAISVTPTSNCDPTQAPPGQSVAYVYLPGIVTDPRGGWTEELKRQTTDNVLRIVSEYYDGFDREIGRFVETPRDREKRVHVTNGCVTHVDFASTRMRLNRPAPGLGGPAPIVPGLFIGGNGIHPGGGISGMAGKTAANRVHRYLKK